MEKLHFEYIGVSDINTGWADNAGPNYGWVDGLVRGFNIEFRHKETGKIDYSSCIWTEGNIEDYYQKQVDDWGYLGFILFETEYSKGYEPTGRAVFRGYGTFLYDPDEREAYVEPAHIEAILELKRITPNSTIDPHKSILENTHKVFRIFDEAWGCIDEKIYNGKNFYLLENEIDHNETSRIVIDAEENIIAEDVQSFSDYEELIADLRYPMGDFIDEAIDRLQEYIEENFSLDRTARGLVHDILQHAKLPPNDLETKTAMLSSLLYSIGIEKEEIEDVLIQRERGEERE